MQRVQNANRTRQRIDDAASHQVAGIRLWQDARAWCRFGFTNMIRVMTFAGAAELAGCDWLELDLQLPVSADEIKQAIIVACPPLEKLVSLSRLAVDNEYVHDSIVISQYQEIALIPPVSGG